MFKMIKFLKVINSYRYKIISGLVTTSKEVQWRLSNNHNMTSIGPNVKNSSLIIVGHHSYGQLNVESFENPDEKLIIGSFVSIASNVVFILGGNHQINTFTTYPLKAQFYEKYSTMDAQTKGPVIVEDEVWIGTNVTVISGVKIGRGSIVAAGSVVTKDVKPFSIVGGNPAKFIKFRIADNLIADRQKMNLSEIDVKNLSQKELSYFYQSLDKEVLNQITKIT